MGNSSVVVHHGVYSHPYHYNLPYGKREAEAEAEADPLMNHHTGVGHTVAGVYNAHVPGVHHVAGVHPVHSVAPVAPVVHAGVKHVAGVYSHPFHYNLVYGKREAEPEAKPYTMGQVYAGLPVANVAGVHPAYPGVYSHPYHLNVMYGKREAEPEAEADPLMYHHTGFAGVAGVHPVHTSVYNHHVVPAVHHGVNHVAGLYNVPVSTVNHFAGVHHAGVYNTYPYLG